MVVGERSVEQAAAAAASCQPANMAMQTIKGMYVNNEMTAITRQRNRHDCASAVQAKHVSSLFPPPSPKRKIKNTHQTLSAGRPAAPPSPYQSLRQPASVGHATLRRPTRAERAPERGRIATHGRGTHPPLPCANVAPNWSPCAVVVVGGHACGTRTKGDPLTVPAASRAR